MFAAMVCGALVQRLALQLQWKIRTDVWERQSKIAFGFLSEYVIRLTENRF